MDAFEWRTGRTNVHAEREDDGTGRRGGNEREDGDSNWKPEEEEENGAPCRAPAERSRTSGGRSRGRGGGR